MWLYPLPALVAIIAWTALFFSTGFYFALGGAGFISTGIIVFMVRAYIKKEWPFQIKIE